MVNKIPIRYASEYTVRNDHPSPDLQLRSLTWISINSSWVSFWRIFIHLQECVYEYIFLLSGKWEDIVHTYEHFFFSNLKNSSEINMFQYFN